MSNNISSIFVLILASLVVGACAGAFLFPHETVKTVEKEVKVTVEVPVDKIVNQTVEVNSNDVLLNKALDEYNAELEDNDDLLVCGYHKFSSSDVSQSGDIKELSIETDSSNRKDTVTTVNFDIKNKFVDGSDERPCYKTYSVEVTFHSNDNKDTEITVK